MERDRDGRRAHAGDSCIIPMMYPGQKKRTGFDTRREREREIGGNEGGENRIWWCEVVIVIISTSKA